MTTEEKAKRYDETLERLKEMYNNNKTNVVDRLKFERYFPELKESEDERMIQYFKDLAPFDKADELYEKYGFSHKDAISWLEKQGGHANFRNAIQVGDKVTRNEDGVLVNLSQLNRVAKKQGEQKHVPDWMPKFLDELRSKKNYFDWDEHKDIEGQILAIIKWMNPNYFNGKDGEQKPAKNKGMNLKEEEMTPFQKEVFYIIDTNIEAEVGLKQECDTLLALASNEIEQKTIWSEEDKMQLDAVIHLVSSTGHIETTNWLKSLKKRVQPLPNQKWSDGDEAHLHSLITHLEQWIERHPNTTGADIQGENISWLKSLKDRVQPKPMKGLSEEDESIVTELIGIFESAIDGGHVSFPYRLIKDYIRVLKSCLSQNTWKPSDEQIKALNYVVNLMASSERPTENDLYYNILKSLRQQLKKLMEE